MEYRQKETSDSPTTALWQSYQHSQLVAYQEEHMEENYKFSLRSIFVHTSK
jgi:hypothetical protein